MVNSDPSDTLIRLVRGTPHAPLPGQVEKIRALAGVSAVGAAAYAQQARNQTQPAARVPEDAAKSLSEDRSAAVFRFHAADATLMIRAMIAAASADGEVDAVENRRILGYLRDSDATPAETRFAQQQMQHASTVEDLARRITNHETAVEVYAAALLTADGGNFSTRLFLGRLASALKLDQEFVTKLHAQWGDPPPVPY